MRQGGVQQETIRATISAASSREASDPLRPRIGSGQIQTRQDRTAAGEPPGCPEEPRQLQSCRPGAEPAPQLAISVVLLANAVFGPARVRDECDRLATMVPAPDTDPDILAGGRLAAVSCDHESRPQLPSIFEKCKNAIFSPGKDANSRGPNALKHARFGSACLTELRSELSGTFHASASVRYPRPGSGSPTVRNSLRESGTRLSAAPRFRFDPRRQTTARDPWNGGAGQRFAPIPGDGGPPGPDRYRWCAARRERAREPLQDPRCPRLQRGCPAPVSRPCPETLPLN